MAQTKTRKRPSGSSGGKSIGLGLWLQTRGAVAGALTDWTFEPDPSELKFGVLDRPHSRRVTFLAEYFDMDAAQIGTRGVVLVQFKATSQESLPQFGRDEAREIIASAARTYLAHRAHAGEPLERFVLATNRHEGRVFAALTKALPAPDPTLSDAQAIQRFGTAPFVNELWDVKAAKTMRALAVSIMKIPAGTPQGVRDEQVDACLAVMLRYRFAKANEGNIRQVLEGWLASWGFLPTEFTSAAERLVGKMIAMGASGVRLTPDGLIREHLRSPLAVPLTFRKLGPRASKRLAVAFDREPPTPKGKSPVAYAPWMVSRADERRAAIAALTKRIPYFQLVALVGDGGTGKTTIMHQVARQLMGLDPEGQGNVPGPNGWGPYLSIKLERTDPSRQDVEAAIEVMSGRSDPLDHVERRLAAANGKGPLGCALCLAIDGLDEIDDTGLDRMLNRIASYIKDRRGLKMIVTCRTAQRRSIEDHATLGGIAEIISVGNFDEGGALRQFNSTMGFQYAPPVTVASVLPTQPQAGAASVGGAIDQAMYVAIQHPLMFGSLNAYRDDGGKDAIRLACEGDLGGLNSVARRFMRDFCVRVSRRLHDRDATPQEVFAALKRLAGARRGSVSLTQDQWEAARDYNPGLGTNGEHLRAQCVASGFIDPEGSRFNFRWRHEFVGAALVDMEEPQWP